MAKYIGPVHFQGNGYTTLTATPTPLALFNTTLFTQFGEIDQLDNVDTNTFEFNVGADYKITVSYVSDDDTFTDASFQLQIYNATGAAVIEAFDFPLVDAIFNAGTVVYILEDAVAGRDYEIRGVTPTADADVKFTVVIERLD